MSLTENNAEEESWKWEGWDLVRDGEVCVIPGKEKVKPSLFDKKGCKKTTMKDMKKHIGDKLGFTEEELMKSEKFEQLFLKYCVKKLQLKGIDDKDIDSLVGTAKWSVSQEAFSDFFDGYLIFSFPTLAVEKRTDITQVLNNNLQVVSFTQEYLENRFGVVYESIYHCNFLSQHGYNDLIFICIADFCNGLIEKLAEFKKE